MAARYVALAYYLFVPIEEPHAEVAHHKHFFEKKACTGRIYISEEGINGQMSGVVEDVEDYMAWLKQDPRFVNVQFKSHASSEQIFPRMTIKYRKQLVALDQQVDVTQGGEHVSPEKWKKMLESGEYLILDVRNHYEWEIGHFEGAVLPPLENFREFPDYAEHLSLSLDPVKTKVMMYCTGGIRCELFSAVLKNKGFKDVYQLEGGVINYGLKEGNAYWRGKLFVFDDRLAVPLDGRECEPISHCLHCKIHHDIYYNCANMDCNALFVCCASCLEMYTGCCSFDCKVAPRIRSIDTKSGNKPFRRKHEISCSLKVPESDSE